MAIAHPPALRTVSAQATRARDSRIDFLRGLALLFIFHNHYGEWTGHHELLLLGWRMYGFSDAAELFVFLSGLVCGLSYGRVWLRSGAVAVFAKAWQRVGLLYLVNLLTLLATLQVIAWAYALGQHGFYFEDFDAWLERPGKELRDFLLLGEAPICFDILVLYMQLLALLPLMLWLDRRRPRLALTISIGLWLYAPFFEAPSFGSFRLGLHNFFNPLAWQLMFFIGLRLGRPGSHRMNPSQSNRLYGWALAVLAASVVGGVAFHLTELDLVGPGALAWLGSRLEPWASKEALGPLRLIHFLALALVVGRLLKDRELFAQRSWARPILAIGRHPLPLFCFSIPLLYAVKVLAESYEHPGPWPWLVSTAGMGLMMALGEGLEYRRRRAATKTAVSAPRT